MASQPYRPDVGVHLILIADDQILLGQRVNTGFADGQWSVPGGHLEDAESLPAGASREAYEELGISIRLADLAFAHISHHFDPDSEARIGAFFVATRWIGEPVNAEPEKCAAIAWFGFADLPENTVDYVRTALEHYRDHTAFGLHGW
jgi:8-oxo-dGTP diphosphatase